MNLVKLLFLLSMIFFIYSLRIKQTFENNKDICRGYLTNKEYLEHMIPHHQVAVDISLMLQQKTTNPIMHEILRKLIWTQNYEINLMKHMLNRIPKNNRQQSNKNYHSTVFDFTYPNKFNFTDTYCDPHFFDPTEHMKHMSHMILNDKTYIEHMIPHHQVAVDMSKKLLRHTNNTFMINLAYRIIRSQQEEIVLLHHLLNKNNTQFKSNITL